MPRAKKTADAATPTVSADDFLAELEASDDAIVLDEEDEIVSEDDILAELNDSPAPPFAEAETAGSVPPADTASVEVFTALTAITDLMGEQDRAFHALITGVEQRISEQQNLLAKAVGELLKQMAALTEAVKTQPKPAAVEPGAPQAKAVGANAFVSGKPAADGAVDRFMLKEITAIVKGFPPNFQTDVPRLAKVIHSKRFAGDPAALSKIEALCRHHLEEYGEVSGDMFRRYGDISL